MTSPDIVMFGIRVLLEEKGVNAQFSDTHSVGEVSSVNGFLGRRLFEA